MDEVFLIQQTKLKKRKRKLLLENKKQEEELLKITEQLNTLYS